jgi:hypothetical protein
MSSILEQLTKQLASGAMKDISRTLGADEKKTTQAASLALPAILGALSRNASSRSGAEALSSALSKDHDGGVLDDISGFLKGAQAGPGDGILRHVLGENRARVESNVSRGSGLDAASVSKLLTMLAPVVMGALGRQQQQKHLDANALAGLLGKESRAIEKSSPAGDLLGQLLDSDGDGDFDLSDVAKKGGGLLGKLLGGR